MNLLLFLHSEDDSSFRNIDLIWKSVQMVNSVANLVAYRLVYSGGDEFKISQMSMLFQEKQNRNKETSNKMINLEEYCRSNHKIIHDFIEKIKENTEQVDVVLFDSNVQFNFLLPNSNLNYPTITERVSIGIYDCLEQFSSKFQKYLFHLVRINEAGNTHETSWDNLFQFHKYNSVAILRDVLLEKYTLLKTDVTKIDENKPLWCGELQHSFEDSKLLPVYRHICLYGSLNDCYNELKISNLKIGKPIDLVSMPPWMSCTETLEIKTISPDSGVLIEYLKNKPGYYVMHGSVKALLYSEPKALFFVLLKDDNVLRDEYSAYLISRRNPSFNKATVFNDYLSSVSSSILARIPLKNEKSLVVKLQNVDKQFQKDKVEVLRKRKPEDYGRCTVCLTEGKVPCEICKYLSAGAISFVNAYVKIPPFSLTSTSKSKSFNVLDHILSCFDNATGHSIRKSFTDNEVGSSSKDAFKFYNYSHFNFAYPLPDFNTSFDHVWDHQSFDYNRHDIKDDYWGVGIYTTSPGKKFPYHNHGCFYSDESGRTSRSSSFSYSRDRFLSRLISKHLLAQKSIKTTGIESDKGDDGTFVIFNKGRLISPMSISQLNGNLKVLKRCNLFQQNLVSNVKKHSNDQELIKIKIIKGIQEIIAVLQPSNRSIDLSPLLVQVVEPLIGMVNEEMKLYSASDDNPRELLKKVLTKKLRKWFIELIGGEGELARWIARADRAENQVSALTSDKHQISTITSDRMSID